MIWSKTEAGRAEMQTRALVKERAQRNLLLLVDGVKSEELLLASVVGSKPEDFKLLESLKLIDRVAGSSSSGHRGGASAEADDATQPMSLPGEESLLDYGQFTSTLTQLISAELGLRGFTLTLAVEKAGTIEELRAVAERVVEQIRERKGDSVAHKARKALFAS